MNFIERLLIFRVDAIAMGIAQGTLMRGDYAKAWEISYLLAQKKHKKKDCLNFAEAVHLCMEILERNLTEDRLKKITELCISSECISPILKEEEEKLTGFLKGENMNDLAANLQESLDRKFNNS